MKVDTRDFTQNIPIDSIGIYLSSLNTICVRRTDYNVFSDPPFTWFQWFGIQC